MFSLPLPSERALCVPPTQTGQRAPSINISRLARLGGPIDRVDARISRSPGTPGTGPPTRLTWIPDPGRRTTD